MRTRINSSEKQTIASQLSDSRLYALLRSICPAYERSLHTVRPSAEEVHQEAVAIYNNIRNMDEAAATAYCRGLYDETFCLWRDATESAQRQPSETDLATTAALVLYSVRTLLSLTGEHLPMICASIIDLEADRECHDQWLSVEAAFSPHIGRAIRDGLGKWLATQPESVAPSPSASPASIIARSEAIDKIDLLRIIYTMCEHGFFVTAGTQVKASKKAVFNAFATMLGDSSLEYDKAKKDLGSAKNAAKSSPNDINTEIFAVLSKIAQKKLG